MENNTKLSQQMTGLYATMHKWEGILAGCKAFALANDGVVDAEEKAQIDRLQGEIDAIKARIVQISSKKGIVLEQVGASAEPPSSQEMIAADEPMGLEDVGIGEFAKVLLAWCVELDEKLVEIKKNLGTVKLSDDGRIALSKKFTSTIPVIQELQKAIDAKIGSMTTIGEVCDLLIAELQKYNSEASAKAHYKTYEKAYKKDKSGVYSIMPTPEQIKATLEAAVDKTDPNHPENIKAEEEKRKAEEEAKKAKAAEFDKELVQWSKECDRDIIASDSMKQRKISKSLLKENIQYAFGSYRATVLTDYLQKTIVDGLKDDEDDGLNSITLQGLIAIANKATDEARGIFSTTNDDSLFRAWLIDKTVFPHSGRLRNWLEFSVPMQQIEFTNAFKEWIKSVGSAVSSLYNQKTWVKFNKKRLLEELAPIFSYGEVDTKELFTTYILPVLAAEKNELISVETLNALWKKALSNLQTATPTIYTEYLQEAVSLIKMIEALPQMSDIGIALDQSEYFSAPSKQVNPPKMEDSLMVLELDVAVTYDEKALNNYLNQLSLAGTTLSRTGTANIETLEIKRFVTAIREIGGKVIPRIPLAYKEYKVKNPKGIEELRWFPTPNIGNMKWDSVDITLNVTKMELRILNSYQVDYNSFRQKYRIAMDFTMPQKTVSAAASLGNPLTSNEFGTVFSIDPSTNTLYIDLDIEANYENNQVTVKIANKINLEEAERRLRINGTWLNFSAINYKEALLTPFP